MSRFEGRLVLVGGVSAGIGLATARRLADEGATVIGVARDIGRAEAAVQSLAGTNHQAVALDLADEAQLAPLVAIGKERGGFHAAVCCAGAHEVRPFSVLKSAHLQASYAANVVTAFNCAKVVTRAASAEGASVVWLSSVAAIRGTPGFAAYSAAKGALVSGANVLALELAPRRIRVNVVVAGVVETAMSEGWMGRLDADQRAAVAANHPLGLGRPDQVAAAIAFLASDDSSWMTGSAMVVDGGLSVR